jgi:glutamine amidotransferase
MCRHLAYLGPPRPLTDVVLNPPLGLMRQSYVPRDMRGAGNVNVDGFGVGWYPGPGTDPVRYRSGRPIWADESFEQIAGVTSSGAVLAAVRSATEGMPVVHTACAPFTAGRWLFSHNGSISGWPDSMAALAGTLPVTDLLTLDAATDSALLWAVVRRRLGTGADPGETLAGVVAEVAAAAPGSRLNLLLTDGATVWGTAWGHALTTLTEPDGVTVASESLDDRPDWTEVPEGYLITATATTGVRSHAIGPPDSGRRDQPRAQRQGVS